MYFRVVLVKVREKAPLKLPGWDASELVIREDTPISQMSQVSVSSVLALINANFNNWYVFMFKPAISYQLALQYPLSCTF